MQLKSVPKSEKTKLLILSLIRHSILFQNVDYQDEETLINAMEERTTIADETVIQEGENGDALFIVESGEYDCYKVINGENKYLKTYKHGDAFGELALMYNAPRAATIKVKTPGTLYSLDRITFSQVVKNAATKKR
jgi:cAMP-dependent protein kinase regulator